MPNTIDRKEHEDIVTEGNVHGFPEEPLMRLLRSVIRASVRVLAVLMTLVIVWGVVDVLFVLVERLMEPRSCCSRSAIFWPRSARSWPS